MKIPVTKKLNPIHSKLNWQLKRNESKFQEAIQRWFAFNIKQIQLDLKTKFQKDLVSELTDWEYLQQQGQNILKPATLSVMQTGGDQAYNIFQVKGNFDVLNVRAVSAAEKFTAKLVRQVNAETKKGIRTYISAGIKEGKSMSKIAKELRPLVGLTQNQTQSILNYKTLLSDKDKFPGLSASDIDKKVGRYASKTHRRRTMNISRTETARAQTIGYTEGMDDLGIQQLEHSVSWDERLCPICEPLNGMKYNISEGRDAIPVHPQCRCALLPVVGGVSVCRGAPGEIEKAVCFMPDSLHDEQIEDLKKRWENAKSVGNKWNIAQKLKKLGYDIKTMKPVSVTPSVVKPPVIAPSVPKPVVSKPKPPAIAPKPKPVIPKSYFDETTDWDKRLAAHKQNLKERMGFDLDVLKVDNINALEYKEAFVKFEKALKSYTKPTKNLKYARKEFYTTGSRKFVSGANKYFDILEDIGGNDVIKHYSKEKINVLVHDGAYRANASVKTFNLNFASWDTMSTQFHEYGHLLEHNKSIKTKAFQWVKMRGKGTSYKYSDISSRSKDIQNAFKDKFIDTYVGKFYADGSTEVLSTGMQQFTSYKSMLRFAKKDFDHFSFIHGILTGAI